MLVGSCHHSTVADWDHLYSQARSQIEQGYLSNAVALAEEGLRKSEHLDPNWNWKFRLVEAEAFVWQKNSSQALRVLAMAPPAGLANSEGAVQQEALEAMAYVFAGQYEEAETRLEEADKRASKSAPSLRPEVALFEGNDAYTRASSAGSNNKLRDEQYAIAEQRYQLSLQLARQYQQPYIEAGALIGLGITATGLGHFDEGIDWSFRALDLARGHQFRLAEHYALGNLGWSYEELGDLDNAIHNLLEELKVVDSLNQPRFNEYLLNNLGGAYLARGNYVAARDSFLKAVRIAKELEEKQNSDEKSGIVFGLNEAAAAAVEENKLVEARDYSREASAIYPDDPLTRLISAKIEAADQNLAVARAKLEELLAAEGTERIIHWDAEDALAEVFAEQHQTVSSRRTFQQLIREIEKARSDLHVVESRLAFSSHAARYYDDYVRFLVTNGRDREAFQVAEFSRARTLEEGVGIKAPSRPSDLRLDRIQSFLRQHRQVVLSYWLAAGQSYIWLISATQFQMARVSAEHEINEEVRKYNKLLPEVQSPEELEEEGDSLYQMLIAPMQKFIPSPGQAKLVIIPDGDLNKLNFETLRITRPSPHYWIEDVETEVASSTTVLINSRGHKLQEKQELLLVGNPIQASNDYPPLTHAGEELQRVKNHFSKDEETIISGKEATPSVYLATHPEKFTFIHFVTHGTASELSPLESAIILSQGENNSFKLYARDIVKIPIRANIVTISACYGAGKRAYSGEGLVGLAWAFMRAGAHHVVAGLWDVDDRASVDLMDDFYTQIQKTKSASAALHAAKLKMINAGGPYRLPYYWASLQLYTGS